MGSLFLCSAILLLSDFLKKNIFLAHNVEAANSLLEKRDLHESPPESC